MVLSFEVKCPRFLTRDVVAVLLCLICSLILPTNGQKYWCTPNEPTNPGPPLPTAPTSFSTRIQVNYQSHGFASEIIRKVDGTNKRDYMEVKAGTRHVVYYTLEKDDAFITVTYTANGLECKTDRLSQIVKKSVFDEKVTGPFGILQIVEDKMKAKKMEFQSQMERDFVRGIPVVIWKACEFLEDIGAAAEVTLYYSDESWVPAHPRYVKKGQRATKNDIVQMQVHVMGGRVEDNEILLTADFFDYQAVSFDDNDFQTPELVHCAGYNTDKKAAVTLPKYFSYNSEIVKYSTASGDDPVVSHRSVHYDFDSGLARIDYQGAITKDSYSPLAVKVRTYIYDFNLGLQYTFEPLFGGCSIDVFNTSLDVFDVKQTGFLDMLDPMAFFYLDSKKDKDLLSYKGVYETRGLPTDLYSMKVWIDDTYRDFFWYFTSDRTKLVEDEVLTNVLVKMISRPITGSGAIGAEDQIEINFYSFTKDEPTSFTFDITMCYNESSAKEFVITFPGEFNIALEETLYLFKLRILDAILNIAGVSSHRVAIQQIYFRSPYLLVQFKILDLPPILGSKPLPNENSLDKAVSLLKAAVKEDTLRVEIRTSQNVIIVLRPEPNGFKEFQGERPAAQEEVFHESSFVGMAIGMTVLGFLLGGIVVNLIITKKYGVSLLQSKGIPPGAQNFDNPLNESSM